MTTRIVHLDTRSFSTHVVDTLATGTVTHVPSVEAHGQYAVDVTVLDVQYKFTMYYTGAQWVIRVISVFDAEGKMESLDAFMMYDKKVDRLFARAIEALAKYKNHGKQITIKGVP